MIANISSTESTAKRPAEAPASSLEALGKSSLRVLRLLVRNPMTLAGLLVALLLMMVHGRTGVMSIVEQRAVGECRLTANGW